MAQTKTEPPTGVVEHNILLTGKIMQFLMDEPQMFEALPENFELVIIPDDDPAIRQYNLELLDQYASEDRPIVFARVHAHPDNLQSYGKPKILVPVPIAA